MPWSRRNFLTSTAAGLVSIGAKAAPPTTQPPRYLITVLAEAGWDVTLSLDPKLGLSTIDGPELDATGIGDDVEAVQTFGGIDIVVNNAKRPRVTDWFTRWHPYAHMVRGIWMGAIPHDPCRFRLLTGTRYPTSPDVPTIVGYTHGTTEPLGTLDLSGWSLAGPLSATSGRVGYQSQLKALVDPGTVPPPPTDSPWNYPIFEMDSQDRADVLAFLVDRAGTYGGQRTDGGLNDQRISDLLQSWDRSDRFREQSSALMQSLVYGEKPDLALQVSLTVDMLQAGLCRTASLVTTNRWDTHANNAAQHGYFDDLFDKLDLLAVELDARGMMEQTLVVVYSEMCRTPRLNPDKGKDHWPYAHAMLFGGGVRGSSVSGKTNDIIEGTPMDFETGESISSGPVLKYDSFAAGLLEWMDVDPGRWLPDIVPFRGMKV